MNVKADVVIDGVKYVAAPGVVEYWHIELERGPSLVVGVKFGGSCQAIVYSLVTPEILSRLGAVFGLERLELKGRPVYAIYTSPYQYNNMIIGLASLSDVNDVVWRSKHRL